MLGPVFVQVARRRQPNPILMPGQRSQTFVGGYVWHPLTFEHMVTWAGNVLDAPYAPVPWGVAVETQSRISHVLVLK